MTIELIIHKFGYAAIFIGTFLEGETVLTAGGFAAHSGYLNLKLVILAAFCGAIIWDQTYFFLGHYKGASFIAKKPRWQARMRKLDGHLKRHQTWLILSFRFVWGTRTLVPFMLGMSGIRISKFVLLNVLSGIVWATLIGTGGYLFGTAVDVLIGNVKYYEKIALAIILVVGLSFWLVHSRRIKKRTAEVPPEATDPS